MALDIAVFGIFADAHCARDRRYGNRYCDVSFSKLERCMSAFRKADVEFIVSLGDIINGEHGPDAARLDRGNLRSVSRIVRQPGVPVFHVLGNHDLESLTRTEALAELQASSRETSHSLPVGRGRAIFLDTNYRADGTEYSRGNFEWTDSCLPEAQLHWLARELEQNDGAPVFVFAHQNIDPRPWQGPGDRHVIANDRAVRAVLESSKRRIVVIQGHYHKGYYQQANGIEYVTLRAICEGPDATDDNAFAVVRVRDDGSVSIEGFGAQAGSGSAMCMACEPGGRLPAARSQGVGFSFPAGTIDRFAIIVVGIDVHRDRRVVEVQGKDGVSGEQVSHWTCIAWLFEQPRYEARMDEDGMSPGLAEERNHGERAVRIGSVLAGGRRRGDLLEDFGCEMRQIARNDEEPVG